MRRQGKSFDSHPVINRIFRPSRAVFIYTVNDFSKIIAIVSIPFYFAFFKYISFSIIATIYSDITFSVIVNCPLNKNTERGFTLVELIVVLVILAILAALLIPALTGYIDKARKSQVVAETRALTQAVQTEMSTIYALNDEFQRQKTIGKNLTIASKDGKYGDANGQLDNKLKERYAEIIHLSEVPILEEELESTTGKSSFFAIINKKGLLSHIIDILSEGILMLL